MLTKENPNQRRYGNNLDRC